MKINPNWPENIKKAVERKNRREAEEFARELNREDGNYEHELAGAE